MGIQLPDKRRMPQIQPSQFQVPTQQILQVMGQNPYAQAVDQVTPILAQALQRRAQLRQQALATQQYADLAGVQAPPQGSALSPEQFASATNARQGQAEKRSDFKLKLLEAGQGRTIVGPNGQMQTVPGLPGLPGMYSEDANGVPSLSLPSDFQAGYGKGVTALRAPGGSGGGGGGFKDELALSKEFQTNAKPYVDQLQSSTRALSLANQQSPSSDAALAFALTRGAMGGSGRITQTEIQQFGPQLGSYPDRVQQFLLGAATGKKYDPAIRADVIRMVNEQASQADQNLSGLEGTYRQKAQAYNFNPNRVVTNLRPTTLKPLPNSASSVETPEQRKARLIQELSGAK